MDLATYHNYMGKKNKYGAIKTSFNGVIYDSKAEAHRAMELNMMVEAGIISNLERQVKFPIIINDIKVFTYIADFTYEENGKKVIEDVKGMRTAMFNLKKKCVEAQYGVVINLI